MVPAEQAEHFVRSPRCYHETPGFSHGEKSSRLKAVCDREGIDLTQVPLTMDSWFVSQPLRQRLHALGFTKIIIAGKSNYTFTIDGKKQDAAQWKKALVLHEPTWGIDVPSCRVHAQSPTF